ncbi:unnamed protein product, partial [Hapterophycus canaliculatus]
TKHASVFSFLFSELYYDRGNHYEFSSVVRELDTAGALVGNRQYRFDFNLAEKPYESYSGLNVRLRYFVRVTIATRGKNVTRETEFVVQNIQQASLTKDALDSLKMEVGIEDCLHIEFEYDKSAYHLQDVVIGKIYFLLVRIKIKHMEMAIIRRETAGTGSNMYNESETIIKYEVMDGAPAKGKGKHRKPRVSHTPSPYRHSLHCVPLRVFLKPYALTPTYRVPNKFTVKYFLNLVLVDEEDRR